MYKVKQSYSAKQKHKRCCISKTSHYIFYDFSFFQQLPTKFMLKKNKNETQNTELLCWLNSYNFTLTATISAYPKEPPRNVVTDLFKP